jgi:hypothetical protein
VTCPIPTLPERGNSTMRVPLRRFSSLPWFVDPSARWTALHPVSAPAAVPADAPDTLKHLHSRLSHSPHLDLSTLVVCQPRSLPPGPPLPTTLPKGRRRRGRTYGGEGIPQSLGGIWNWIVMAQVRAVTSPFRSLTEENYQVKEGTENRGAVESVVRLVRKTVCVLCRIFSFVTEPSRNSYSRCSLLYFSRQIRRAECTTAGP